MNEWNVHGWKKPKPKSASTRNSRRASKQGNARGLTLRRDLELGRVRETRTRTLHGLTRTRTCTCTRTTGNGNGNGRSAETRTETETETTNGDGGEKVITRIGIDVGTAGATRGNGTAATTTTTTTRTTRTTRTTSRSKRGKMGMSTSENESM